MALTKIPAISSLVDTQFVEISGPDGIKTSYHYDAQTQSLYLKESQVIIPSGHGTTHIAEDPIPVATCDTPGLMSSDDKCRLDTMLQTRLGVLGFMGAGFPDDGGWMSGDVILAAGSGFIHIERIGNVIKFVGDSPLPLNCDCSSCTELFWVQDEVSPVNIRPPSCGGKLPGISSYGEIKIYLFPESTIVSPTSPASTLNQAGSYPSMSFTRYTGSTTPNKGQYDLILERDTTNTLQAVIGWTMTPGTIPQCVWFMGKDDLGELRRYDLDPSSDPGLLGALLYKGHNLTKQMAVVTGYTSTTLSTNVYKIKLWNVKDGVSVGDELTATNTWRYNNPTSLTTGSGGRHLQVDATYDVLPVGTLVDLWFFKTGEVNGVPTRRYFFNKEPVLDVTNLWATVDSIEFGNTLVARQELQPGDVTERTAYETVTDLRAINRTNWNITGTLEPVMTITGGGTDGSILNVQHRAEIDPVVPALMVLADDATDPYSTRPVILNNALNLEQTLIDLDIGLPGINGYTPYDIILRGQFDGYRTQYMKIAGTGVITDTGGTGVTADQYLVVRGVHFQDLPPTGVLRCLTGTAINKTWTYTKKLLFAASDMDGIVLAGEGAPPSGFDGGNVVELLAQEYNNPVVRIVFDNDLTVQMQFWVGNLDMSKIYNLDVTADDYDDYMRGLSDGFKVSTLFLQDGAFSGVGTPPTTNAQGVIIYNGGSVGGGVEIWNRLRILHRADQIWIWWNGTLIPPNYTLTGNTGSTPYFPMTQLYNTGKFGLRLWPGSKVRRATIRSQMVNFSEYSYGQLSLE